MELTAGYPFWLIRDGMPFQYPKVLENLSTSVLIIGGGISAALTAFYLTEAGISCVVVDARSIGLGSTCASTSLLQYELDIPLHMLAKKIGWDKAARAYQLCGEAIDKLVGLMDTIGFTEFEERESLYFSTRHREKKFIEAEYEARKKAGFEVTLCPATSLQSFYGLKAEWGILSKKAACTNAYGLTHSIFQYCIKKGLLVFDRSKVKSISGERRPAIEMESGHIIRAEQIVNATGYEVIHFLEKDIIDFYCTYAIISESNEEQMEFWKERVLMWNTEDPYLYVRLTQNNQIIVGGRDERFSNRVTRELYLSRKADLLEDDFKAILPDISFKREFSWSGTFGKTKDALPYIGALPSSPNIYYALGFGGNGICFSQIAGEIIRDLVTGKVNADAALFAFDRT